MSVYYTTDSETPSEPVVENAAGPVGQGDYVVKAGDCMDSIAVDHGFFWETLWNLSENSELKSKRKDPNVLLPGDRVTIPELRPKEESRASDAQHKFRRKGVPAKLRLRLLESESKQKEPASGAASDASIYIENDEPTLEYSDKPRANVTYILIVDGKQYSGNTDGDGRIEQSIPPNASSGKLILNPGKPEEEVYPLQLGGVDPKNAVAGVQQRLSNLGLLSSSDVTDEELSAAIRVFQQMYGLDVTGRANQETVDKLYEVHGS